MSNAPAVMHSIARMQPGDHYCGIYRTDEDHRRLIVDFVRDGIARHEQMLYIVNLQTAAQLRDLLAAAGLPVDELVASGQLVVLTAGEAYLKGGEFEPAKMIDLIAASTEEALGKGYNALRITGEMTWALAGEPGSERLIEYESLLNRYFPGTRSYAICQYDRRRFDAEMLLDVVQAHPDVLHGHECYDNSRMYYIPPDQFLGADRQDAVLERWLHNISASEPRPVS